jgi:hypothetical protein
MAEKKAQKDEAVVEETPAPHDQEEAAAVDRAKAQEVTDVPTEPGGLTSTPIEGEPEARPKDAEQPEAAPKSAQQKGADNG